ncbi:MAG: pyruvate kinase alpha/beta domain-containing protein [Calditrichia bacterium]
MELKRRQRDATYPIASTIGYCACHAAQMVNASAIVVLHNPAQQRDDQRFRPMLPIIAMTWQEKTYCRLALLWGVRAFRYR